jgi:hypothetical protein
MIPHIYHILIPRYLSLFLHTDAMVVTVHIDRWDVARILVDNDTQAEILFLSAFKKMGYD